jgi:hypothetical protein
MVKIMIIIVYDECLVLAAEILGYAHLSDTGFE